MLKRQNIFLATMYNAGNDAHADGYDNDDDDEGDQRKEDNYDYSDGGGDG